MSWIFGGASGGGYSGVDVIAQNQVASGDAGPNYVAGWNVVPINIIVINQGSLATLVGNTLRIPAGTYEVMAWACVGWTAPIAAAAIASRTRIYDATGAAALFAGINSTQFATSGADIPRTDNSLHGQFTINVQSDIRLDIYSPFNSATAGVGVTAGTPEIYGQISLKRVT